MCMWTDTQRNTRMDIYVRPEERKEIVEKAGKLGISISKLLVNGALQYQEDLKLKKEDE